ncbi:hypothetical protein ES703_56511 [subsurface metagenome]
MAEFDIVKVNKALVKSLLLCAAVRRLLRQNEAGYRETMRIEHEIREAASECQRFLRGAGMLE